MMKSFSRLLKTEIILSIREFSSIFFGVIFPVGIVLLMGIIYGNKPAYEGSPYTMMQLSFGAFVSISICATGLMGLPLNVSNYREKKVLKRFKVTPVSPIQLLSVQVTVSFLVAIVSGICVYWVSRFVFGYKMEGSFFYFSLAYLLVTIALYSIGMMIASVAPNLKTANFMCTLLYFPMLFLSGATVPYEIMPRGLQLVSNVFPLTQGIKFLQGISLAMPFNNFTTPILILTFTSLLGITLSLKFFKWE